MIRDSKNKIESDTPSNKNREAMHRIKISSASPRWAFRIAHRTEVEAKVTLMYRALDLEAGFSRSLATSRHSRCLMSIPQIGVAKHRDRSWLNTYALYMMYKMVHHVSDCAVRMHW
jgi:hypothetical protein